MPLDGAMVATPPAGTTAVPNTVVASAPYNALKDDIYNIFNTKIQPLAGGGSGSSTAIGAFDAFTTKGADIATAATVNLDTATGAFDDLTGTTTVTAVTLAAGKHRMTRAAGDFLITTSANLVGGGGASSVQVKAGDLIFWEGFAGGIVRFWVVRTAVPNSAQVTSMDSRPIINVNGCMQDSPENTTTLGSTNGYFWSEMWADYFTASGAAVSSQLISATTLNGNDRMGELKVTTIKAGLAASDFRIETTIIEGSDPRWKASRFGTAGAKQLLIHAEGQFPVAGLYHWHFSNSAGNRHCSVPFTISAPQVGIPIEFGAVSPRSVDLPAIIVPPDTGGTWLTTEGSRGLVIDLVLAAGTTLTGGSASTWGGTNFLAASTQVNTLATLSTTRIADVGIKIDPDATATFGLFRVGEKDTTYRPERYSYRTLPAWRGAVDVSSNANRVGGPHPVKMAKSPTSATITGTITFTDGVGTVTALSVGSNFSTQDAAEFNFPLNTGVTQGRPAVIVQNGAGSFFVQARL